MILYALIVRATDGLALSATTDFNDEINKNIKSSKRYVKLVVKKINQLSDRCMLNLGNHTLYLITSLGVGYFVLCDSSYPSVLAYSFLSELNREFITKYERSQIETCKRPYSFIEFDNYIHRARQRYNKPQSLTTKINLSELSTELRLRPAYKITLSEIESVANGYSSPSNTTRLQAVVRPRLNKLFWYDYLSCTLTLLLTFLDLWRGISAVAFTSEKIVGDTSSENGMLFLLEGIFRISQCYLMVLYFKRRILCTWICLVVIALFEWGLSDLRDGWQSILFFAVALFQHFCCSKKTVMTPNSSNFYIGKGYYADCAFYRRNFGGRKRVELFLT